MRRNSSRRFFPWMRILACGLLSLPLISLAGCGENAKEPEAIVAAKSREAGAPHDESAPAAATPALPVANDAAPSEEYRLSSVQSSVKGAASPDEPLAAEALTVNNGRATLVVRPGSESKPMSAPPDRKGYALPPRLQITNQAQEQLAAVEKRPSPADGLHRPDAREPRGGAVVGFADADGEFNTESYAPIVENDFLRSKENPLSTFSIDVDTASYANVRRFLSASQLPPAGAVRLEELVNYFSYDYAPPTDGVPFAARVETASCPWNAKHHLVRIGLKGKVVEREQRPVSNLVFLIDVSGSMQPQNKLPLVKESLKLLVNELGENDRIAICVYAGSSGLVLPSTTADNKEAILSSLDNLQAGGSTNGGAGIVQAYNVAVENFIPKGTNRVILCTDGDFNVGTTSQDQLMNLITEKAKSKVFLSVLGFGYGNVKDSTMELLADKGNGNYAYIDTLKEGRKVLVEEMSGTLITIAKDVKIQVDFNPAHVAAYRLLGYENRLLKAEDFKDDKKDAGEIGAGHTVTALYEVVPPGVEVPAGSVEPSKYQHTSGTKETKPGIDAAKAEVPGVEAKEDAKAEKSEHADELLTVRLRYKQPESDDSTPLEIPVKATVQQFDQTSADFQFATAVVQFGMLLRDSKYKGGANWDSVLEIAEGAKGKDANGYRAEFIELVRKAKSLKK
jgi:Ca-activated chloride channel family protein